MLALVAHSFALQHAALHTALHTALLLCYILRFILRYILRYILRFILVREPLKVPSLARSVPKPLSIFALILNDEMK